MKHATAETHVGVLLPRDRGVLDEAPQRCPRVLICVSFCWIFFLLYICCSSWNGRKMEKQGPSICFHRFIDLSLKLQIASLHKKVVLGEVCQGPMGQGALHFIMAEIQDLPLCAIMSSNSGRGASRHQFGKGKDLPNPIEDGGFGCKEVGDRHQGWLLIICNWLHGVFSLYTKVRERVQLWYIFEN
ncbi:hypothetical protein DVH24_024163 [Malus domestica]|uniref:Uncharacterized protein n=1 Tax=Malus domestica TaxID=3750 RepID=A0A498JF59_MALDO|nr:hypothetical protein DVH24_024163 [Malus domestica]